MSGVVAAVVAGRRIVVGAAAVVGGTVVGAIVVGGSVMGVAAVTSGVGALVISGPELRSVAPEAEQALKTATNRTARRIRRVMPSCRHRRAQPVAALAFRSVDDRPIGMFDSGFGGLTVARALIDLLPEEDLVYFGDTARYPYGPKSPDEVRAYASQITTMLVDRHDVKMVVVACNTASACALELLRFDCDLPIVGVVDPGVRSLVEATRNGRVGVIGTIGTVQSGAYQRAVRATRAPVTLTCSACPGFVEFVERGETESEQVHVLAERLLAPLIEASVDTLLLGCTHYPFLARTIGDVMGRDVVLVSSADETAFEVRSILADTGGGRRTAGKGAHRFVSSGDVAWFRELGSRLLGPELDGVEGWSWVG